MKRWLVERFGIVRIRQWIENLSHRLSFLPIVFMAIAVVVSQLSLWLDRSIGEVDLPEPLSTSVDSARAVFSTIAGGLITAVTLLLSMMLVAIQLASANFSPRTLRNWLGDEVLRRSIAVVMATIVFCLLGLRSVRVAPDAVDDPTVTVLIAVVLALVSLVAVIRAVDHVTTNMQVGSVTRRLVDETMSTLATSRATLAHQRPVAAPVPGPAGTDGDSEAERPDHAVALEAPRAGWVQQIDEETLAAALPEGTHVWIDVSHGDYVMHHEPLAHVVLDDVTVDGALDDGDLPDDVRSAAVDAFAIGETRTMQQDVGFGIGQLADIAVRALSPGVNDPATAEGVVVNLGEILREIWSHDTIESVVDRDGRTIHRVVAGHEQMLRAALDPIRRHARAEPSVATGLARMVCSLRAEVERSSLPGPIEPLDRFVDDVIDGVDDTDWLPREREELREVGRSAV